MKRFQIPAIAMAVAVLACAGCTTSFTPLDKDLQAKADEMFRTRTWEGGAKFQHVIIVVLENGNYEKADTDAVLRRWSAQGARLTNFHAVAHPSYPNYLSMVSGTSLPTRGDQWPREPYDALTIADRIEEKGLTWKNYAERYPGHLGDGNWFTNRRYARRHVPFLSFASVQKNSCENVIAIDPDERENAFTRDLASDQFPNYAFYTPDLHNNGHDTDLETATRWLDGFLQTIARSGRLRDTLVVVTFDEDDLPGGSNHIFTLLLGAGVKRADLLSADALDRPYTHYNVLRTIEANFGLRPLAEGDGNAAPILDVWQETPNPAVATISGNREPASTLASASK